MTERVAICLRGAVAKKTSRFPLENQIYVSGEYVNYAAVKNSIQRHIVDCNKNMTFDFFIHCWSTDLENELVRLYNPVRWKFEDNRIYNDEIRKGIPDSSQFGQLSSVLSMKKSLELVDDSYDRIILVRPDVLLWKDMNLSEYEKDVIYVNRWIEERGDFHFVMSSKHKSIFENMYPSAIAGNLCFGEGWIKKCILDDGRFQFRSDNIRAGVHEEVLRQIKLTSVDRHGIRPEFFVQYGLDIDEITNATIH